jgi:hypothetical protein
VGVVHLIAHNREKRTPYAQKSKAPEREELVRLIRTKNFSAIGRLFNVSGNSVKKWCRKMGLPDSPFIIQKIPDDEWEYACQHWDEVKDKYVERPCNDDSGNSKGNRTV